jgi:hypothetical protein
VIIQEGETLINGINALIKETPDVFFVFILSCADTMRSQ